LIEWKAFYVGVLTRLLLHLPIDAVLMVYCTDVRQTVGGCCEWVSKSALVHEAVQTAKARLIWHKIVSFADEDAHTIVKGNKASYSHLHCIAGAHIPTEREAKPHQEDRARATGDILLGRGTMLWPKAMGVRVCEFACRYIKEQTHYKTIVDPFCGHGALLSVANQLGLHSVGVELSAKRAENARHLTVIPRDDETSKQRRARRKEQRRVQTQPDSAEIHVVSISHVASDLEFE